MSARKTLKQIENGGTIEEMIKELEDIIIPIVNPEAAKHKDGKCCICGKSFKGYGNNPKPYKQIGRCCDKCNSDYVIPTRLSLDKLGINWRPAIKIELGGVEYEII